MAKYLILIYGDEQSWETMSEQDWALVDAGHRAFNAAAGSAVLAAGQLHPTTSATTLRAGADGRPAVTDGPFLETKEAIGGYYVVDATDLDQVTAWAAELHEVGAGHSGVEIRPLVEH